MSADLSTRYLGFDLSNPLVASAGPLTGRLDALRRLEDAGVAAVVLPSLFQEQIEHEELELHRLQEYGAESFAEAMDYFPELPSEGLGPESYLDLIRDAKDAVNIPVIASLNGSSKGGWASFARQMSEAGADAIELNVYFVPTSPDVTGAAIEERYLDLVAAVRAAVTCPVAVKIGPYFSSLPNMARRLVEAGAGGLVVFNRYLQPELEPDSLDVRPQIELSRREEARLPLQWIAILRGRIEASLAHTTGLHAAADVARALLVGADVTMMTSALLKHGIDHVAAVLAGLATWMEELEYESVEQLKGSMSRMNAPEPGVFERANYMKALAAYTSDFI